MAKIETTFIRPKELYTPETGETKVVYDGYQNNPHELITEDGFAGALDTAMPTALAKAQVIETTWQELKDKRDNGQLIAGSLYRITDYNCTTTQENTRSAGHQFDIVLLALSANKLAEEGWAMEHPTDVYDMTFADGIRKVYIHKNDDNECNIVDVETLLGLENYIYHTDDGDPEVEVNWENHTAIELLGNTFEQALTEENVFYNYFQNSNLSAWKVWYCLDNDKSRFAWADDSVTKDLIKAYNNHHSVEDYCWRRPNGDKTIQGVNYYYWANDDLSPTLSVFTTTETPTTNDKFYWFNGPVNPPTEGGNILDVKQGGEVVGRGVIYRLIDEYNNDVAYDFKNIQFKRWAITALTSGSDEMKAALIYDADENPVYFGAKAYDSPVISGATLDDDNYIFAYTFDGALKDAEGNITHYDVSAAPFVGPQEFIDYMIEQEMGEGVADVCYDNFIGNYGEMDIEGDNLAPGLTLPNNVFFNSSYCYFDEDEDYWSYAFANCYGNSLKSYCSNNTFGNGCQFNTFGNSFYANTFGNNCYNNTFGNNCARNTFGNYCTDSTFGNGCGNNTFGNSCAYNTFGNSCLRNTFGNDCGNNTFGNMFQSNTFGNYCSTNTFGNSCQNNTFGNNCGSNTFGNGCGGNTFGNNAEKCSVGDGVQDITVSKDFMRYVIIENGNQKITITSNKTTSSSAYLQNFLIALGVNNSNNTKTISHNSVGDAFRTVYQNENSTSVDV